MLKQLVLEAVVDVFLDDDVFFVSLWGGKREETLEFIDQCGTEGGGVERCPKYIPRPIPRVVRMHPACRDEDICD